MTIMMMMMSVTKQTTSLHYFADLMANSI